MSTVIRRIGPYELLDLVGGGGMGEVWRARDTRLDRIVAVKLLRGELTSRFEREARAISSLSHPNICTLYDIGADDGTPYLVMEYCEGATPRGPMATSEALHVALQVAGALSAAHRAGIVHRDLKPANVIVSPAGVVKLVDFGLARPPSRDTDDARSGDRANRSIARPGTPVGTPHYMAPEQLEGREADARSDVFAFGLLLYELLTGRRAFEARSQAGIIAAVMHEQPPPITSLASGVPPALERIVRRAIEKDPDRRWQTIEAMKDAVEWVADSTSSSGSHRAVTAAGRAGARGSRWPWAIAALSLATAAAAVAWALGAGPPPRERLQVEVALPEELPLEFDSLAAIAPNGRSFVVNANKTLWLRSLEDGTLRALAGTTGAVLPFWSPDGQWVAFFADGKLKKLQLPDGAPVTIADAPNPRGGTWSAAGVIVYAPQALGALMRIDASGGTPAAATTLDARRQEEQHSGPVFLPDGTRFLYHARSVLKDNSALALGSLDGLADAPTRALAAADTGGWYAPPAGRGDGYLLFLRRRDLIAQRFDLTGGQLSPESVVLARRVRVMADAVANMSVGARGQLLYVADEPRVNQPRWYSRDGTLISSVGDLGEYLASRVSPSGELLASVRADPVDLGRRVWVLDLARNVDTQIAVSGNIDDPVWSPDSERLAFAWSRPGEEVTNIYETRPDQPGEPRPLLPPGAIRWPLDWSPDGRLVLYAQIDSITKFDLWTVPVDGSGPPQPLVRGPGKDNEGRFSPDGRSVAYQTDDVRETRVYLMPYPPDGRHVPISEGSGGEPRWRADGRELYYVSQDGALVSVPITAHGDELRPGRPVRLFGGSDSRIRVWHYDPAPDGQRFLVLTLSEDDIATPVHLVTGWQ